MENNEQFIDNSNDRKYYTTIPNIIVNTYAATESGVYLYIKKKAGETGEFFETQENACKHLGMNRATYRKILKKLQKDKIIKFSGQKIFKTSPVDVYTIIDIWADNMVECNEKRHGQKRTMSVNKKKDMVKRGPSEMVKRGPQIITNNKKEPINSLSDKSDKEVENNLDSDVNVKSNEGKIINELIGLFKDVNVDYQKFFARKPERRAIAEMLNNPQIGLDKLQDVIKELPRTNVLQYAPVITSPYVLQKKYSSLIAFIERNRNQTKKGLNKIDAPADKYDNIKTIKINN